MRFTAASSVAILVAATTFAQPAGPKVPQNMFIVKPIPPATPSGSAEALSIQRGRFFSYALPAHWRVGEEGQFALTLVAPDNQGFTLMVGNAGLPPNYPPDRYVHEKLMAIHPRNVQISSPRQTPPRAGFHHAIEFDVAYISQRGIACRGVAKVNVAPAYDTALLVMTGAFSVETQWSGYSKWLPLTAEQIAAVDGAAFGRRGIMAQNLQLSKEYGEAARAYREWSQRNWQQVTDQRDGSVSRRNEQVREVLGPSKAYINPYDSSTPVELPLTYKYYWVNRQGTYAGTNDPSVNPNQGSTGDWKQMPPRNP